MTVFLSHCTTGTPKRNAGIEKLRRQADAAKRKSQAMQKLADGRFEVVKDYRKEIQQRRAEFAASPTERKSQKAKAFEAIAAAAPRKQRIKITSWSALKTQ